MRNKCEDLDPLEECYSEIKLFIFFIFVCFPSQLAITKSKYFSNHLIHEIQNELSTPLLV